MRLDHLLSRVPSKSLSHERDYARLILPPTVWGAGLKKEIVVSCHFSVVEAR